MSDSLEKKLGLIEKKLNQASFFKSNLLDDKTKRGFELSKVIFITPGQKGRIRLYHSDYSYHIIYSTLRKFQEKMEGEGYPFIRTHKSYLVNYTKIEGVDKVASGHYELTISGIKKFIPLTRYYAPRLSKLHNLEHLDYLEPYNTKSEKVRSYGLYNLGRVARLDLDTTDKTAVKIFIQKYGIHRFSKKELMHYFKVQTSNKLDKPRIIRNIIWQVYCWIKWGVIPKFSGSIRSLWYKYVSYVLKSHQELKAKSTVSDENAVYDYFNDFVELGFFTYEDFGFKDPFKSTRGIGDKHPEIMLFAEKSSLLSLVSDFAQDHSISWLMTRGQVPWITAEFMAKELKKKVSTDQKLTFLTLTDLNPGGLSIAVNLKKRFEFHGFKNIECIPIIDISMYSDHDIEDFRFPLISWREKQKGKKLINVPISLRDKRLYSKYHEWFFGSDIWPGINDPRLITRKPHKRWGTLVTIYGLDADILDHDQITKKIKEKLPLLSNLAIFSIPKTKDLTAKLSLKQTLLKIIENKAENSDQKIKKIHKILTTMGDK